MSVLHFYRYTVGVITSRGRCQGWRRLLWPILALVCYSRLQLKVLHGEFFVTWLVQGLFRNVSTHRLATAETVRRDTLLLSHLSCFYSLSVLDAHPACIGSTRALTICRLQFCETCYRGRSGPKKESKSCATHLCGGLWRSARFSV